MITLRGKLTRTLVARPLPNMPKATRSSAGGATAGVVAKSSVPLMPPASSADVRTTTSAATTAAVAEVVLAEGVESVIDISGGDAAIPESNTAAAGIADKYATSSSSSTMVATNTSCAQNIPGGEKQSETTGQDVQMQAQDMGVVGEEEEGQMVEEWTWRGIWAFGDLADDDDNDGKEGNDKNNNVDVKEEKSDITEVVTNDVKVDSANQYEVAVSTKEVEIQDNSNPATNTNNDAADDEVSPTDSLGLSTTDITAAADEGIAPAPIKNRPGRKKKKRRNERSQPTSAAGAEREAAEAATKPRPFLYKWLKPVNASEVVVPSALVIMIREAAEETAPAESESGGMKDIPTEGGSDTTTATTTASSAAIETAVDGDTIRKDVETKHPAPDKGGDESSRKVDVVMKEASVDASIRTTDGDGDALMKGSNAEETLPSVENRMLDKIVASDDANITATVSVANTVEPTTMEPPKNDHTQLTAANIPPKEIKMQTYGDSPYTDASGLFPLGTCPTSGKWDGSFENVIANSSATTSSSHSKKKRSHSRSADSRVREMFYLFFNATPPPDARPAFSDTDSTIIANEMLDDKTSTNIVDGDGDAKMEDGVATASMTDDGDNSDDGKAGGILPPSHIHVRGYGTNRFGTFEIVGSLNPTTGTLKCQRMYVPVPTPAEISKVSGKDARLSGRYILPGENEDGAGRRTAGRKRKSSWKKRESDIGATGSGGEFVTGPDGNLIWKSSGRSGGEEVGGSSEGRAGGSSTIDIASIVKKRPRHSYESTSSNRSAASSSGGVVGGGILKPPPQCRGTDNGPMNLQISSGDATFAPGASITAGGSTSKKSHKKKSKSGVATGAQPRSSTSSAYKGMQGTMSLAPPPSVIPTLPSAGDPMLARWRAAHFLYFQRVEQEPEGEGTTPASGGKSSSSTAGRVKINYVVYEGEMHDGMRDGRGICLYNNNTLYEGQWKKNKEHGIGKLMTADRKYVIYEGSWEKGKMHGQGAYNYYLDSGNGPPKENGKYVGQFRQNLRNGHGVYTLPNGSVFDGEFRDNIQNGYGIFRWPDGSIYEGPWRDGKRHGAHGILVASDGFRYEGSWVNNSMEGRGVAVYPKGQVYDGTWVAGKREGRGTIRFTNGAVCKFMFTIESVVNFGSSV